MSDHRKMVAGDIFSEETPCLKHDRLKQDVLDWMDEMGRKGRFVLAHQAPMWKEYEEAANAL